MEKEDQKKEKQKKEEQKKDIEGQVDENTVMAS